MTPNTSCKFQPGQIIHHKKYDYRGVIFDVDENCKADDDWYMANKTHPDRNQPWYHVLVDGKLHTTYVAEENLEADRGEGPVDHPLTKKYFDRFESGRYHRNCDA